MELSKFTIKHILSQTKINNMNTYKVKFLFQFGSDVPRTVCVCILELSSSNTQKAFTLPLIFNAVKPLAPCTVTVSWPTSFKLLSLYHS